MTEIEIGLAIQEAVEELEKAINKLALTKKQIIQKLAEQFEKADYPLDMISEKIILELHTKRHLVAKSYLNDCLDQKYKYKYKRKHEPRPEKVVKAPENVIEDSNNNSEPVIMTTTGEQIGTDDDPRSEQSIQDEVNKSMYHERRPDVLPYETMEQEVKKYNQVMMEQGEKIKELQSTVDEYKVKLKAAEEKTKDAEYIKLEEKLSRLEEINERLLNENKQYSEAILKRSFESATNVKTDPQQIKNYESTITSLEAMLKQKNEKIEELDRILQSYAHIDRTIEPQPLELDVKPFVGVIFANRGNKVRVLHDGRKVLKITGGDQ